MDDITEIGKRVLRTEAEAVSRLVDGLDSGFAKAVYLLFASTGRVVVIGMGKSGIVGRKIAATLASTGTPAFFVHPAEAGHGDLGMITPADAVLAVSKSGETREIVELVPFFKRCNVRIVAMTGNPDSTIAKAADAHLDVSVEEEACSLGIVPTASTTAAMAMGDAVAVALLIARGFTAEDFALFHPGGSLGKKLLVRVRDLMHTGPDLPLVSPNTSMAEAVVEISAKRLGLAVVAEGRAIRGVITDGDVRRGLTRWGKACFDLTAEQVMTRDPKLIAGDELAARALAVMERLSITSLVVPDADGMICGVIHLHDILKEGIV
jgi:arabinose-5-phosphate isomerase